MDVEIEIQYAYLMCLCLYIRVSSSATQNGVECGDCIYKIKSSKNETNESEMVKTKLKYWNFQVGEKIAA